MPGVRAVRVFATVILLLFVATPLLHPPITVPKAHAVTRTFTLYAYLSGWNFSKPSGANPTITVSQGDTISFTLINKDPYAHLLLIDFDANGVTSDCSGSSQDKCSGNLGPGSSGSISPFVVTAAPGQYSYYCRYHSPAYMVGTLIVQGGPDYGVSSSPSALTILQGTNENSTISVTSLAGFSGQVGLSATTPPSWSPPFFSANPVTVSAGMTSTSKLTIYTPSTASPGSYTVTVTAHNSTTSHSTDIAVTIPVPDFSIAPSSTFLTINSGSPGTDPLTISAIYGFSGTVSLAATVPLGRATVTLSPPSVTLSSTTTSGSSTLTISSALGSFNTTVTATSGSTSHSIKVLVNGPDFTVTVSPTSLSVNEGSSATLTVTLSGVSGFSGTVSLSAVSSPSNGAPPISLSSATLMVPSSGTVTSILTVTTSSSGAYSAQISTGNYTITLNATMGSLSHVETIPLTVTSSSFGVGLLTNPFVIGGIVAAIVVVGVAAYVLTRRPKK